LCFLLFILNISIFLFLHNKNNKNKKIEKTKCLLLSFF
jgi:hypothetical protein